MALGQTFLDSVLARQQPIHGCVQLLLVGVLHREVLAQRAVPPTARGRQLALRVEHPCSDHRRDQTALARGLAVEHCDNPQTHHRGGDRLDRAVGPRADDLEQFLDGAHRLALEYLADRFGLRQGQRREVGDGALDDPLAFAGRLAQEDRRAGFAIGDDVDVHVPLYSNISQ